MLDVLAVVVVVVIGIVMLGTSLFAFDFLGAVGRKAEKFVEDDKKERASEKAARAAARAAQPSLATRGAAWGLRKQVESGALSREDALKSLMELRSRGTYLTREEAEDVLGDVGRDDSKPKSDLSDGSGSDQ